jgi:hypothetical protein
MKPRLPGEVEAHDVSMAREGILFVGEQGSIMAGFQGQDPQLFTKGNREPLSLDVAPPAGSSGTRKGLSERQSPWLDAVKGGEPSPGSFLNAAAITDTVNLGTVALRAGTKVVFDSQAAKITNVADANKYLVREYRKGWEL